MAEPTEDERDHISGFMHARLSRGYEAEVYPQVEGLRPIRGPEPIAPGRWLATWRLAQGGTLVVEARSAGDEWHVIVVGSQREAGEAAAP